MDASMLQPGATSADFVDSAVAFGYTSCELYVLVVHTKKLHDYRLLSILGMFGHEPLCSHSIPGGSAFVDLAKNRTVKLFKMVLSPTDTKLLLASPTTGPLTFPNLANGKNQISHGLAISDPKPITYLPESRIQRSPLGFLPRDKGGITLFELVDVQQNVLQEFDPEVNPTAIEEVDELVRKHIAFSFASDRARIGNVIITAAIDDFRIHTHGHASGRGLHIKCVPTRTVTGNYIVTVTSVIEGELTSGYCSPLQLNGFLVPNIDVSGELTIDVFDLSTERLVARDYGVLIRRIETQIGVVSAQRQAILRHPKTCEILHTDMISVATPTSSTSTPPRDWHDRVWRELASIRKRDTLKRREVIPCGRNQGHLEALKILVELVNLGNGAVKIWDPYAGRYVWDFLTFLNRKVPVQIISDLDEPPPDERPKLNCTQKLADTATASAKLFAATAKNCFLSSKAVPSWLKKPIQDRDAVTSATRFAARLKFNKDYLDQLRSMEVQVKLRYPHGGRGFPFHDRFLFVGSRCWSLGISINQIGESHSLILEVPYPEVVEKEFDDLWDQLEGFEL